MASASLDIHSIFPELKWIDGIPYEGHVSEEIIRKIPDTPTYDDDIFVTGYAKSGTNWIRTTVAAIMDADDLETFTKEDRKYILLPIEYPEGYEFHCVAKRPRIGYSNMRYDQFPRGIRNGEGREIHISRNPKDVAVSTFHFAKIFSGIDYSGSWNTFFEAFMASYMPKGLWYDHLFDWSKHRDKGNILFIKYEDYIEDSQKMINKIAMFLGKHLKEETVTKIDEIVSFKSMKSNPKLDITHELIKGSFLRKGMVGDWVNYFTPEQERRMDEMYQKFKEETRICFRFN